MAVLHALVDVRSAPDVLMWDVLALAKGHPGNDILQIEVTTPKGSRFYTLNQKIDAWDLAFCRELGKLLGHPLEDSL